MLYIRFPELNHLTTVHLYPLTISIFFFTINLETLLLFLQINAKIADHFYNTFHNGSFKLSLLRNDGTELYA